MTIVLRALRTTGVLLVLVLLALPANAQIRPNSLDLRINALSTRQLLASPAAALVDPDRQIAAARYSTARIPGLVLTLLLPIGLLVYFWRSGWASAHRDRLRRRLPNEFAARWVFAGSVIAIAWSCALLPQFYLYRLDRVMGTSQQSWTSWAAHWVLSMVLAIAVIGTVLTVVLWLTDRTHQWYLYTLGGVVLVTVLYAYAAPMVAEGVRHAPADRAVVIGLGPSQRIVLSESLLRADSAGEVRFQTARATAHVRAGDPLSSTFIFALIVVLGIAVAVAVADRIGFRRDDDPVSRLALVVALLGCVYVVALPIYLSYLRASEARADGAAIAMTGDRASAVRAMVRRADQEIELICPTAFDRLYFARTPAIGSRIASFNGTANPCS